MAFKHPKQTAPPPNLGPMALVLSYKMSSIEANEMHLFRLPTLPMGAMFLVATKTLPTFGLLSILKGKHKDSGLCKFKCSYDNVACTA